MSRRKLSCDFEECGLPTYRISITTDLEGKNVLRRLCAGHYRILVLKQKPIELRDSQPKEELLV
jgi:hypothetical protein